MRQTRTIFRLDAVTVCLLWAAILVFANLIAHDRFARVDLNANKLYSLDPISRKAVWDLPYQVKLTYYISEKALPPRPAFVVLRQDVEDLLKEYRIYAGDKLTYEIVDPVKGDATINEKQAETWKAQEGLELLFEEVQRAEETKRHPFFSSLKVSYADKTELINGLRSVASLEYELTRTIRKMRASKLLQVGFLLGDDPQYSQGLTQVKQVLERIAEVREVKLGGKPDKSLFEEFGKDEVKGIETQFQVPDDLQVLFVIGPKKLEPRVAFAIDQFVMRGGRVVFCLEARFWEQQRGMLGQRDWGLGAGQSGLEELLASYGVRQRSGLIYDLHSVVKRRRVVLTRVGIDIVPQVREELLPMAVISDRSRHDARYPFVAQTRKIITLFTSALEPLTDKRKQSSARYVPLIRSSAASWEAEFAGEAPSWPKLVVEGQRQLLAADAPPEGWTYGALLEGGFSSHYEGQEIPQWSEMVKAWKEAKREQIKKKREAEEQKKKEAEEKKKKAGGKGQPAKKKKKKKKVKSDQEEGKNKKRPDAKQPDKKKPDAKQKGTEKKEPEIVVADPPAPKRLTQVAENRVVVIGDADWLTDQIFLWQDPENEAENGRFVQGLVEWLGAGPELARLQSKGASFRPLDQQKVERRGTLAAWLMIGLAPLVVLALGLLVWGLRQHELEQFEQRLRQRRAAAEPGALEPVGSAVAAGEQEEQQP